MGKNHKRGVDEALSEKEFFLSIDGVKTKDKMKIIDVYSALLNRNKMQ